jgi:hypothetical protein
VDCAWAIGATPAAEIANATAAAIERCQGKVLALRPDVSYVFFISLFLSWFDLPLDALSGSSTALRPEYFCPKEKHKLCKRNAPGKGSAKLGGFPRNPESDHGVIWI